MRSNSAILFRKSDRLGRRIFSHYMAQIAGRSVDVRIPNNYKIASVYEAVHGKTRLIGVVIWDSCEFHTLATKKSLMNPTYAKAVFNFLRYNGLIYSAVTALRYSNPVTPFLIGTYFRGWRIVEGGERFFRIEGDLYDAYQSASFAETFFPGESCGWEGEWSAGGNH